MKTAIVVGSIRKERQSHKVAYYLYKELKKRKMDTDIIDTIENPLPPFSAIAGEKPDPVYVQEISQRLAAADALILVTPEYHGSFAGSLKNLLDYFWGEFSKKPIGVAAASAGKFAGINASTQLQHVILSMGAYPMPQKLLIPQVHHAFNDKLEFLDPAHEKAAQQFLDEFVWLAEAIFKKRTSESVLENVLAD